MIGDNAKADIYGAKKVGVVTSQKIHSNVISGKDENQPDINFNDYSQKLKNIKNIF